jgi:hypothetical protein
MGAYTNEQKELKALDFSKIEKKREENHTRKMTFKQRKFLKLYLESGDATASVMSAYGIRNKHTAAVRANEVLKALDFELILEMAGVSDAQLAIKMTDGLNATKLTKTGERTPDLELRHKYLVTALESKHKIKNKLEVTGENGQPIRFNILAGHGFIPTVPRTNEDITASAAGTSGGPTKVQGVEIKK